MNALKDVWNCIIFFIDTNFSVYLISIQFEKMILKNPIIINIFI